MQQVTAISNKHNTDSSQSYKSVYRAVCAHPSTRGVPTHSRPQLPLAPQKNKVARTQSETKRDAATRLSLRERWILRGEELTAQTDSAQYSRCQPEHERGPEKESYIISISSYAEHSPCDCLICTACSLPSSKPLQNVHRLFKPNVPYLSTAARTQKVKKKKKNTF